MTLSLDYGDGGSNYTQLILDTLAAKKANPVSILQEQGGSIITAYSSGRLDFGPGVFPVSPDALYLTQDLGVSFRGQGSRRTNNSVMAPTTLVFTGASSGFGVKTYGAGARGLTFEDIDITYADSTFTGSVIDSFSSPGLTLKRAYVGTIGTTASTRKQSARSLIRTTYEEALSIKDCVLDGAVDGVWFDNSRGAFGWGGSSTTIADTFFYDFTGTMLIGDGTRSRKSISLLNNTFNPISVGGVRAIDLQAIDAINIVGGHAVGSVGLASSAEWMRLQNCTGSVRGFNFGKNTSAAVVSGYLDMSCNVVDGIANKDGFNILWGIITGRANRFRGAGRYAWNVQNDPFTELTLDIGPDLYEEWLRSFRVNTTSPMVTGRFIRAPRQDSSAGVGNGSTTVTVTSI